MEFDGQNSEATASRRDAAIQPGLGRLSARDYRSPVPTPAAGHCADAD